MEYTFIDLKQYVRAGINTLMSISDGLGLSVVRRKMENARPVGKKMDGKVVYFPPELAIYFWNQNL